MVNNMPVMQETQVQSLGQEDPLEKGMATPPLLLAGEFHEQRSLWGSQYLGLQKVRHNCMTNTFTFFNNIFNAYFFFP